MCHLQCLNLLNANNPPPSFLPVERPPVPHLKPEGEENPLSKRLRTLDNAGLTKAEPGVYLSTNETELETSHQVFQTTPKVALGCHIGFSGWFNFDVMAARRSSLGIICDINPENALFLHHILKILIPSHDRFDFVIKACQYVANNNRDHLKGQDLTYSIDFIPNNKYPSLPSPEDEIRLELKRKESWLNTDVAFEHIRSLALQDKIVLLTEDILKTATFKEMRKIVGDDGYQIDTLYLSNIREYMFYDSEKKTFFETVAALFQEDTLVINAFRNLDSSRPQRITQPKAQTDMWRWFYPPKKTDLNLVHLKA